VAIFGVGTLLLGGAVATGLTEDLGRMIASGVVAASGLAMYVSAALRTELGARAAAPDGGGSPRGWRSRSRKPRRTGP